MDKLSNKNNGFTLVEVLVSTGILVIFLPFVASMLTNSQLMASYSKHKIQAAYAAQQIIETQRQEPLSYFAPRLATVNPVNPPFQGAVMLDNKGNYSNNNCSTNPALFCGIATITMSPETYINSGGQTTSYTATYTPSVGSPYTYNYIAHIGVQIMWYEQVLNIKIPIPMSIKIPMNEYYNADIIVNDSMLN